MKIYFSVSYSNMTEEIRSNCETIVHHLEQLGHRVINEKQFHASGPYSDQNEQEAIKAQKNLTRLKKNADVVVFEITKPSVAIGQELSLALSLNKPVIALYNNPQPPHILRDEGGDLLILTQYDSNRLKKVVEETIEFASENQEVRFNFFISPSIGNYLDWIASNKKIPRSVYLRNLILQDMRKNAEYSE